MAIPNSPRVNATTSGALSAAVVENSFFRSLEQMEKQVPQEIKDLYIIADPSTGDSELYAQYGSSPIWTMWRRGASRKIDAITEFYYTIVNKNWSCVIQYHRDTRADDRTGTFDAKILDVSKRYAFLQVDIAAQLLESTANPDLLDTIPNTYYGLSLFNSNYTFATGGNIITGQGITTESAVRDDLFNVQERFRSMVDEANRRYWESGDVDFSNFIVIIPNNQTQVWDQIVNAQIVPGGFAQTSTKSNTLYGKGLRVYVETRLTDSNDWYVALTANPSIRPFVYQPRQEPEFIKKNMENSDHAFETGLELIGGSARAGYSVYEPRSIVKVSNA